MTRAKENEVKFKKRKAEELAEGRNRTRTKHAMKMRINSRSVQCPTDTRYRGRYAYIEEDCPTRELLSVEVVEVQDFC